MLKTSTDNWTNRARLVLALQPLSYAGPFPAWCIDLPGAEVAHPGQWKALKNKVPLEKFWIHLSFHMYSEIIIVPAKLFSVPWLWTWPPILENGSWGTAVACCPELNQAGGDFIPFPPLSWRVTQGIKVLRYGKTHSDLLSALILTFCRETCWCRHLQWPETAVAWHFHLRLR